MSKVFLPMMFILMASVATLAANQAEQAEALLAKVAAGDELTIVFFGDSLTDGWNCQAPDRDAFPGLVAGVLERRFSRCKQRLIVNGHPGATSADGLQGVERDVIAYDPDLVILQFGGNDKGWGRDVDEYRRDYRRLIRQVQSRTQAVVVTCVPPISEPQPDDPFAEAAREVIADVGVACADLDMAIRHAPHEYRGCFPFGQHPTEFTHSIMANEILRACDELLGGSDLQVEIVSACRVETPGESPVVTVKVTNLTDQAQKCRVRIETQSETLHQRLTLEPEATKRIELRLPLPEELPDDKAQKQTIRVLAWSDSYATYDLRWLTMAPLISLPQGGGGELQRPSLTLGRNRWQGPDDLSGSFTVRTDEHAMRFDIHVTDDMLHTAGLDSPQYGDSVELYLDLRSHDQQGLPVWGPEVVCMQIVPPTTPEGEAQWTTLDAPWEGMPEMAVTGQLRDDGYSITVVVPLPEDAPQLIGFDIGVNDADGPEGRETQMMWAGTKDNYLDASNFAAVTMKETPASAVRITIR